MALPTSLVLVDTPVPCLHLLHWGLDFYTQILGGRRLVGLKWPYLPGLWSTLIMQAVGICLLSFKLALPGCLDQIPESAREDEPRQASMWAVG